jgi:hypothetical protein
MVGLDRAGGNQRIRPFAQRIGRQKSSLRSLLPIASGVTSSLDKNFAAKVIGQARQIFQRRRRANQFQTREAG